ncbi:MAG TPA: trypsin-like peptidase domain-containing protein [Actinoplanes sp.]|nr:trypsin-like peptidase domain-containing protein [Actinoplanes sp.]
MNEHETTPLRHDPSATQADQAATEADPAAPRPASVPADPTSAEPGSASPVSAPSSPSTRPVSAQPVSAGAAHAAGAAGQHASAQPVSAGAAHAVAASSQASAWRSGPGQAQHAGQPYAPAGHAGQSPYASQPQHPGRPQYPGRPEYPGHPQHGQPQSGHYQPGPPYGAPPPYGAQPAHAGPGGSSHAGQATNGAPDGWAGGHEPHGERGTQQLPAWAQPVAPDERAAGQPGPGRKVALIGAAALLLALSAGGIGAAVAMAIDDDAPAPATARSGTSAVTRVVDRSSLAEIASSVQDSVVSISTGTGEGSGVVLTADGYVLTNNHVVASAQAGRARVIFANGKSADATVVGTDPRTDLAVVKAAGVTDLKPAAFGSSADMKVGDTVLALGSPLGLEGSVTAGIVSAKDRTIRAGGDDPQPDPFGGQARPQAPVNSMSGLLQTDAAINPGNSGGALVNTSGQVIGINTAIATSGQGSGNIGVGFAIPSDKAKDVANQLMAGKKVSHPALGVGVAEVEGGGAAITSVTENSAAAKAGLQRGDIVKQVNGKPINDSDDLVAAIQAGKVGDKVTVVYTRDGVQRTAIATLAEATS